MWEGKKWYTFFFLRKSIVFIGVWYECGRAFRLDEGSGKYYGIAYNWERCMALHHACDGKTPEASKTRMGKSVRHPPETSWGDPGSTLTCSASPVLAQCRTNREAPTLQTRDIEPTLGWCGADVYDVGPASTQHWLNVSCLLGTWPSAPEWWHRVQNSPGEEPDDSHIERRSSNQSDEGYSVMSPACGRCVTVDTD